MRERVVSVREFRLGNLTQQPTVDENLTVKDVLFSDSNEIAKVVKEYEDCIHHPETSAERMQAVLEKMEELNAWDYEVKYMKSLRTWRSRDRQKIRRALRRTKETDFSCPASITGTRPDHHG